MGSTFPVDAVDSLTKIINGSQVISRIGEIGAAMSTILHWFFVSGLLAGRKAIDEGLEAAEEKLHELFESLHSAEVRMQRHLFACSRYHVGEGEPQVGIDPATIATIITLIQTLGPMVMRLLEWIRERRNPKPTPTAV